MKTNTFYAWLVFLVVFTTYAGNIVCPMQLDDWTSFKQADHMMQDPLNHPRAIVELTFLMQDQQPIELWHLVNNAIHGLSAVVLFLILLNFTGKGWALFGALAWGLHPLQTSAVTYLCQRYASMAGLFCLLTLLMYLNKKYVLMVLCFSIAWWCKESAWILPGVLLLAEIMLRDHSKNVKRALIGVFVSCAILLPILTWGKITLQTGAHTYTIWERILTEPGVILQLLRMWVLPLPMFQSVSHYVAVVKPDDIMFLYALTGHVFILLVAFWLFKEGYNKPLFGVMAFYMMTAPEALVCSLELMFEHKMYLPSAFLIIAVMPSGCPTIDKRVPMVFLCALACLTLYRNTVWGSKLSLWEDSARKNPEDARSQYNYGYMLSSVGRIGKAEEQLKKVKDCPPWKDGVCHKRAERLLEIIELNRGSKALIIPDEGE